MPTLGYPPQTHTQYPVTTIRELMVLLAMYRLRRIARTNAYAELSEFLRWRYKVDIDANHICKVFTDKGKGAAWFVKTEEEWTLSNDAELQLRFLMRAFENLADGKARPPRPFFVRSDLFEFCAWSYGEFRSVRATPEQMSLENEDRGKLTEGESADPRYQMWLFDDGSKKDEQHERGEKKPRRLKYRESRAS